MSDILPHLAQEVGALLKQKGWLLTTAESCTGGQVAQAVTSIAGSSNWFDRGFVTYSNQAKQEMLGVQTATLDHYGAVSAETVREMAEGALRHSHANISLAVTGIAGPDGGSAKKPVGTVWFAWAGKQINTQTQLQHFSGDRLSIRNQATVFVLRRLLELIVLPHQTT